MKTKSKACRSAIHHWATLENSTHPKALANTAKHFAFNHYGELNLNGIVDAQIEILEKDLFRSDAIVS